MSSLSKPNEIPLVTIGIPTYNRANFLVQTIESVLNQTYNNIEIVISDNASTDQTQSLCEQYKSRDTRITYIRQEKNLGPTPNFLEALKNATGLFFMWLGDDDWIDLNYIEECMNVLLREEDVTIAAGYADYYKGDRKLYTGTVMNLIDTSGVDRVKKYFSQVRHNSVFYGVMRTAELRNIYIQNVLGGDLLMVAAMTFLGKVKSIEATRVHRRRGGESQNNKKMIESMSLFWIDRHFPRISVAYNIFSDITINQPLYNTLNNVEKHQLAVSCVFYAFIKKIKHMIRRHKNCE